MKEDFGRKSIAARKAKRVRENLAQGKPECYQDEGVARIESKTNGRCADCPVEKDCHLQALLLASLHRVEERYDQTVCK